MEIWGTPFKILYIFFRVFARLLLAGKKKREIFFKHTGWGRLDGFMETFGLFSHLIFSHLVKQTHNIVDSPVFSHEREVSEFLNKQKGKLFADVGANFGYYSFLLHDNFQEILAVEPHPFSLKVLTSYKQMYNYEKVKVVPLAVGNHSGQINLYLGKHPGGHSILEERMPKREHLTVNCETLDYAGHLFWQRNSVIAKHYLVLDRFAQQLGDKLIDESLVILSDQGMQLLKGTKYQGGEHSHHAFVSFSEQVDVPRPLEITDI